RRDRSAGCRGDRGVRAGGHPAAQSGPGPARRGRRIDGRRGGGCVLVHPAWILHRGVRMKRALVLGALIAVGALSVSLRAFQAPVAVKTLEVEKLRDNLFILKNADSGGNTAVFVQANGVTVVDTKNPGWGGTILAKIKELTPKPVTMIINTHTHGDHVSG